MITILCGSWLRENLSLPNLAHKWDSGTQTDVWTGVGVWSGTTLEENINLRTGFPKEMTLTLSSVFTSLHQPAMMQHDRGERAQNRLCSVAEQHFEHELCTPSDICSLSEGLRLEVCSEACWS